MIFLCLRFVIASIAKLLKGEEDIYAEETDISLLCWLFAAVEEVVEVRGADLSI